MSCIYHLVRVMAYFKSSSLVSLSIINEFLKVFLDDLPGIPPWEIYFSIDLLLDGMVPTELKDLKDELKDLLVKGFIKSGISPWVLRCCLFERRIIPL